MIYGWFSDLFYRIHVLKIAGPHKISREVIKRLRRGIVPLFYQLTFNMVEFSITMLIDAPIKISMEAFTTIPLWI